MVTRQDVEECRVRRAREREALTRAVAAVDKALYLLPATAAGIASWMSLHEFTGTRQNDVLTAWIRDVALQSLHDMFDYETIPLRLETTVFTATIGVGDFAASLKLRQGCSDFLVNFADGDYPFLIAPKRNWVTEEFKQWQAEQKTSSTPNLLNTAKNTPTHPPNESGRPENPPANNPTGKGNSGGSHTDLTWWLVGASGGMPPVGGSGEPLKVSLVLS